MPTYTLPIPVATRSEA